MAMRWGLAWGCSVKSPNRRGASFTGYRALSSGEQGVHSVVILQVSINIMLFDVKIFITLIK